MSHMVQMSKTNDPDVGQNGLSSSPKHGLISEWYRLVANTVRRASVPPSTFTWSKYDDHFLRVRERHLSNRVRPSPSSSSRLARACSVPRSEKPIFSSTVCPATAGPMKI